MYKDREIGLPNGWTIAAEFESPDLTNNYGFHNRYNLTSLSFPFQPGSYWNLDCIDIPWGRRSHDYQSI